MVSRETRDIAQLQLVIQDLRSEVRDISDRLEKLEKDSGPSTGARLRRPLCLDDPCRP